MRKRNLLILLTVWVFLALTFSSGSSAPKYTIIQLTDKNYTNPQINCKADVVWGGVYYDEWGEPGFMVFLYERSTGTTTGLQDYAYEHWHRVYPQINCSGDVV